MSLLKISNSRIFDCIIRILLLVVFIVIFNYYKNRNNRKFLILAAEFIIAGSVSGILDTAIRGYTIDYIHLIGFLYVDFKDIILDIGIILLIIFLKEVDKEPMHTGELRQLKR